MSFVSGYESMLNLHMDRHGQNCTQTVRHWSEGIKVVSTVRDSSEATKLDLSLKGTNLQIT